MADFGGSPYAWENECIADIYGFDPEYRVSNQLEKKFSEWAEDFERNYRSTNFNWENFNAKGLELAKMLKNEIGTNFTIEYCIPIEDPQWKNALDKWEKESTIQI